MAKEIEDGIVPDPMAPVDPETGMPLDAMGGDPNAPVMEPDLEGETLVKKEMPKGGEI